MTSSFTSGVTPIVICGDARSLPLPDESVDLIVTSPPYYGLRSYRDSGEHYEGQIGSEPTPAEFLDALIDCTREWVRVLKPAGSIWVNLGDKYSTSMYAHNHIRNVPQPDGQWSKTGQRGTPNVQHNRQEPGAPPKSLLGVPWRYALRAIDELGLILRAEVIWSKPNGLPESVTDRVRRTHEQWFHLVRQPRYFAAVDEIREPHTRAWDAAKNGRNPRVPAATARGSTESSWREGNPTPNPLGALPGSVWSIPSEPLKVPAHLPDHFAAFPTEWPRRIIQGWSPTNGRVLDPFGGTGTTSLAASVLGRLGITVDMSMDYCRIAGWRTTDPAQRAKAARVAAPPPVTEGQLGLDMEAG